MSSVWTSPRAWRCKAWHGWNHHGSPCSHVSSTNVVVINEQEITKPSYNSLPVGQESDQVQRKFQGPGNAGEALGGKGHKAQQHTGMDRP